MADGAKATPSVTSSETDEVLSIIKFMARFDGRKVNHRPFTMCRAVDRPQFSFDCGEHQIGDAQAPVEFAWYLASQLCHSSLDFARKELSGGVAAFVVFAIHQIPRSVRFNTC